MLANNFEEKLINSTNINDYFAEYKWDGIRAQIVFSDLGKVFSRSGDDITHSFPDLNIKRSKTSVIDGEYGCQKK